MLQILKAVKMTALVAQVFNVMVADCTMTGTNGRMTEGVMADILLMCLQQNMPQEQILKGQINPLEKYDGDLP